ncbi:MAG: hypothetical protein HY824_08170 [Acidobacteria bacterium]|nr:hypothetical protein [Acidobacteriota bacterium]
MSRVVYSNVADTVDHVPLREAHAVRLVTAAEEGTGVNALPGGVYGFTYSPGLQNAPLFASRRYRSYEIHKLAGGETFVIAFADADTAGRIASAPGEVSVRVQPDPAGTSRTLVTIPYGRVRHHRQYAAPNEEGFMVTLAPSQ